MALIKCSECGSTISDKASACIHCGCPVSVSLSDHSSRQAAPASAGNVSRSLSVGFDAVVSGSDQGKATQRVYVTELGRNVEFDINNNTQVGETIKITLKEGSKYDYILFRASTVSKVPQASKAPPAADSASAQMRKDALKAIQDYEPNFLVRFFKTGFIRKTCSMSLAFLAAGRFGDVDMETLLPFIGIGVLLMMIGGAYPFASIKRYYRKHRVDKAIRKDTGYMNVAISAYNELPTKKMLAYIRKLNPSAAKEIERQLAEKKNK